MKIFKKFFKKIKDIWAEPSEGFGDTFAKITKTFGIRPCKKCDDRRKSWNEKLKYEKSRRR